MGRGLLAVLVVVGALLASSTLVCADPVPPTFVAASLPSTYIADYGTRAKPCRDLVTPPWVSWLSYASATVSDQWRVYVSSKALCTVARSTADAAIDRAPSHDGAGQNLTYMLGFGLHHHNAGIEVGPKPAGRSWTCGVLPSFWGQDAWDTARLAGHQGSPLPGDFAGAAGPAAGAGYCVLNAKLDAQGEWKGGRFFSWAPDTSTCQAKYNLKEIPDPGDPGETSSPPFPTSLWADYDRVACP